MPSWKKLITSGSAASLSSLSLDTALPVSEGGTGATSLTSNGILTGNGTSAIQAESNLTFDGTDLSMASSLIHLGDTNTKMSFTDDRIEFYVGGEKLLDLFEGTQDYVLLGDGGDVDINLNGDMFVRGSDGNVGIATDSPQTKLHVVGTISGSQIESSGDVIAYSTSDRKFKDNIEPIQDSLYKVSQIGGYTFDWNDKQETYKGSDVGVIAQEIQEVLPEVVTERENGLAVKYEKIVPLLIESIKELKQEIDDIKQKCDCLNK